MARDLFSLEKGIHIVGENSNVGISLLFGSAVPGGDTGPQDDAEVGSIYFRTDGTSYSKVADNDEAADWKLYDITNVETALGIVDGASDMGTYTGSILTDNTTQIALNQELETDLEALQTTVGVAAEATDMGTYTGSIITDNGTAKENIQELETDLDALQTSQGIAAEATDFGSFTGTIIPDNSDAKEVSQALETDLEALQTAVGIAAEATDMGTYTGDIITDNSTQVVVNQELETAIEAVAANVSSAAITTEVSLDEINVDAYKGAIWDVVLSLDSAPSQVIMFTIAAVHDGVIAPGTPADAANVDDTVYGKMKLGAAFNHVVSVDINGTGAAQVMRLRISASAAITAVARRRVIEA